MKRIGLLLVAVAVVAIAAYAAGPKRAAQKPAQAKEKNEEREKMLKLAELPAPVKATLLKETKGGKINEIERETEKGTTVYEAEFTLKGKKLELSISPEGKLLSKDAEEEKGEAKEGKGEKEDDEAKEDKEEDEENEKAEAKGEDQEHEKKVTLADLPARAKATLLKEAKGGKINEIERKVIYEAEIVRKGRAVDVAVEANGEVLSKKMEKREKGEAKEEENEKEEKDEAKEEEEEHEENEKAESKEENEAGEVKVTLNQLPAAVKATLLKETKGGKILLIEKDTENGKTAYDAEFTFKGKKLEVSISPEGKLLSKEAEEEEEEEAKEEKEEKGEAEAPLAASEKEFTTDFAVDKANLVDHGRNPYFILEPGYSLIYRHGNAMLKITVLDETRLVDGVKTRVVEEWEGKDGSPSEISRNFFAIDKTTGDAYYFGEEVDVYRNGKMVRHEGEWLSGAGGARFGLMMPGKPKVGDRFYQEQAPKVAMDRCEVVSLEAKITTPAGEFSGCLLTRESSAVESGSEEKTYAPGVGLVQDEGFLLTKVEQRGDK